MPAGVKTIGNNAFASCKNLKEITLNAGLTSLNIPKTVKTIYSGITIGCGNLTEITVDSDNEYFYAENNTLLRKCDDAVIAGCKTSVIPENAKLIAEFAFSNLPFEYFSIPGNVKTIENYAFSNCVNLKEIELCEGIKKIGSFVFSKCPALEQVIIPESVEEMGARIFTEPLR